MHQKKSTTGSILLLVALLLSCAIPVFAANSSPGKAVATVVALRGKVVALNTGGEQRQLAIKGKIFQSDTIKTDARGRIQFLFTDNTIISLGQRAEMKIDKYQWQNTSTDTLKTTVKEGAFRVMGGTLAKSTPQNFTTETPSATIGIRGSMYAGRVKGQMLSVVFQGGKGIFVRNPAGVVEISKPGFGTRVLSPTAAPAPPTKFSSAEISKISNGVDQDEPKDVPPAEEKPADQKKDDSPSDNPPSDNPPSDNPPNDNPPSDNPPSDNPPSDPTDWTEYPDTGPDTGPDLAPPSFPEPPPVIPIPDPPEVFVPPIIVTPAYTGATLTATENYATTPPLFTWGQDSLSLADDLTAISGNITAPDGTLVPFSLPSFTPTDTTYNFASIYSGSDYSQTQEITIQGNSLSLDGINYTADNLGEFFTYNRYFYSADLILQEFGFAGTPSPSAPSTGINVYSGTMTGSLQGADFDDTIPALPNIGGLATIKTNFTNHTVFGYYQDDQDQASFSTPMEDGFFFATTSGHDLTDITFFGSGEDLNDDFVLNMATAKSADFYGSANQGFGWSATGDAIATVNNTDVGDFKVIGAAFLEQTLTAPTTDKTWNGFATGLSEFTNLSTSTTSYTINKNSSDSATDLVVSLGATTGLVGGSINMADNDSANPFSINLGTDASAYIDDSWFAAMTTSSISAATKGLFIPELTDPQWSQYFTWGWWGLTPYANGTSKVEMDGLWVAGERSANLPATTGLALSDLLGQGSGITGHYAGQAEVNIGNATTGGYNEYTGSSVFDIDFSTSTFNNGSIDFNTASGPTFSNITGNVDANGIHATTLDLDGTSMGAAFFGLDGDFFGNDLAALAGNFFAQDSTYYYSGIFGGDLDSNGIVIPTPPNTFALSGNFISTLNNFTDVQESWWYGPTTPLTIDVSSGLLSGTLVAQDSTPIPINLSLPSSVEPTATYDPLLVTYDDIVSFSTDLTGTTQTTDYYLSYDNLGEFFTYKSDLFFTETITDYMFTDFGYAGIPSTTLPTDGIVKYSGQMSGEISNYTTAPNMFIWEEEDILGDMKIIANFKNNTVLGYFEDWGVGFSHFPIEDGFFIGTISGTDVTAITFVAGGNDFNGTPLLSLSTTGTANFFGSAQQGFGLSLTGDTYFEPTATQVGNFNLLAAGFQDSALAAPSGSKSWNGFAIETAYQYSDLTDNTLLNTYWVANTDDLASNFTLTLNADTGTVAGTMATTDAYGSSQTLSLGETGSVLNAYIDDTHFLTGIYSSQAANNLGGLLVTQRDEVQWSSFFSWGEWGEIQADATATTSTQTQGLWLAGELSNTLVPTYLSSLLSTGTNLTGNYQGGATIITSISDPDYSIYFNEEHIGVSNFEINFTNNSFTGMIDFSSSYGPYFDNISGTVNGTGIHADNLRANGVTLASTDFNLDGDFFGSGLNALGGSFWAIIDSYAVGTGIFGGDLDSNGIAETSTTSSVLAMTGKLSGVVTGSGTGSPSPAPGIWLGDVTTASSTDGTLTGSAGVTELITSDTATLDFGFLMEPYDPTNTYFEIFPEEQGVTLDRHGLTMSNLSVHTETLGEFAIFSGTVTDGTATWNELGFVGEETSSTILTSLPGTDLIESYNGHALYAIQDQLGNIGSEATGLHLEFNWHTGKVVGLIKEATFINHPVIFYGDVSSTGLTNISFLGGGISDHWDTTSTPYVVASYNELFSFDGTLDFNSFYGSEHQGIGATFSGTTPFIYDPAASAADWNTTIAAVKDPYSPNTDSLSFTGIDSWEGFAVSGTTLMSTDPSQLSFTIDKDTGLVTSGDLSLQCVLGGDFAVNNVEIGGTNGSAYASNKAFVAEMGCSTNDCIATLDDLANPINVGLEALGNYMFSSPDSFYGNDYTAWGYWQVTYTDPTTSKVTITPGLWTAGHERTPATVVQGLIADTALITGTYNGEAHALRNYSTFIDRVNGTSDLTVDFNARNVTGTMDFADDPNIGFSGSTLNITATVAADGSGLTGTITNGASSVVNGAFFGPTAEAIAGNFRAESVMETNGVDSATYNGIFNGALTSGSLQ